MVIEGDLTSGGGHTMYYTDDALCTIGLCTRNLYNFINQCHLNKFKKKTIDE